MAVTHYQHMPDYIVVAYYLLKTSKKKNANGYPLQLYADGELEMMVNCLGFKKVHETEKNRFYYADLNGNIGHEFTSHPRKKEAEEPLFFQVNKTSREINLIYNGGEKPYLSKVSRKPASKQEEVCESEDNFRIGM